MSDAPSIAERLAAPFLPPDLRFRAGKVSGNRALALPYIDVRAVEDRLDLVVGIGGWKDDYEFLEGGSAFCRLWLRIDGEWIAKCGAAAPSAQPEAGNRLKAALSGALKLAAVKWGVGRCLYRFPKQWVDYDPAKKQLIAAPALPEEWRAPSYVTPPAAPHDAPITDVQGDELKAALKVANLTYADACKELGIPQARRPTVGEYIALLARIQRRRAS